MKNLIKRLSLAFKIATIFVTGAQAAGLPEPALVLYGSVTNKSGPLALLSGSVEWTVSGDGSSATTSSTIGSVNGLFFYVARIPFETHFAGSLTFAPSANTLPLTAAPTNFTRSTTVNGVAATLVPSASTNFTCSKGDRVPNVAVGVRRLAASAEFGWWNVEWKQEPGSALTTRRRNELAVVNYEGRKV